MINEFLPFGTSASANILTQTEYAAMASRLAGFASGVAKSKELNKVWRQSSVMSSAVAQFISNAAAIDVLDDGDIAGLVNKLASAVSLAANAGLPYASNTQAAAGASTSLVINPANLKYFFENQAGATESVSGVVRLATSPEALAGALDTRVLTPLKNKAVLAARGLWDVSVTGSANANTPKSVGLYSLNGATNGPDGGQGLYQMFTSDSGTDPTWQVQIAQGVGFNKVFIRSIKKDQSATTPWNELHSTANNDMVGASVGFYLNTPPVGWLKENGAAVSRTTYAKLFAIIGTAFGAGDGSTTFNLPDHRGEFPRGTDDGRNVDPGRLVGSTQGQSIQSHSHVILNKATSFNFSAAGGGNASGGATTGATELTGGTETRPRNIAKLYCIKY